MPVGRVGHGMLPGELQSWGRDELTAAIAWHKLYHPSQIEKLLTRCEAVGWSMHPAREWHGGPISRCGDGEAYPIERVDAGLRMGIPLVR